MKIHDVAQGSPEWHALRASHNCASEAPVMMGVSPFLSRSDLVRMKATGAEVEITAAMQKRFDDGHATEKEARRLVEVDLGEDLYPATATDDDDYLLASFDGLTMAEDTGFEHKLWNEDLAAQVRAKELSPAYYWQLEQQILIAGLERVIFVCSNGTRERFVSMEYRPVPGRAEQLLAGWRQFDEDVKNYQHVEVIPKAVAEPTMALPALAIDVKGDIALASNLDIFGEKLRAFIDAIDKKPSDDQGFANAEAAVKTLQTAQERLEAAEAAALARFTSIDEMRRTVAMYAELARSTRLMLEKVVKARKEELRDEIRREGIEAYDKHIRGLNERLGRPFLSTAGRTVPDAKFAEAMKGKKTITSLRDAVATELARAKIEANAIADRIQINLAALAAQGDYGFLFSDLAAIVTKESGDFLLLVKSRIAEHRAAEDRRLEAEREKIRAEEAAKLQAAQQEPKPNVNDDAGLRLQRDLDRECWPKPSMPAAKARPTDDEIIDALCTHYHVHESQVILWLLEVDLEAASKRLVKQFAA